MAPGLDLDRSDHAQRLQTGQKGDGVDLDHRLASLASGYGRVIY